MQATRFLKRTLAAVTASWLAACTPLPTLPPIQTTPAPSSTALPTANARKPALTSAAMSADLQGTALILPMDPEPASFEIFSNPSRPSQLAGLPARELERGGASWYGPGFQGRLTASGERYNMNAMTAAHRTLPFGTWVRVHSLVNGREIDVRITDRGPFIRNRVIDLSRAAATALGMLQLGFKEVVLLLPETAAPAELANGTVVKVQPKPKPKPVKRQQPKITG